MILRKPFALLIKHFKLIHTILMVLMIYILYSTNSMLSFMIEYLSSTARLIDHSVVEKLFNVPLTLSIVIVLIGTIVVMGLMAFKKKPIKYYIFNIVVYIYAVVIILVAKNNISALEVGLLEVRTLKLVQDLLVSSVIFQGSTLLFMVIRATGFDIKKFNFVKDLEELEIEEEDNEEFEVSVNVDSDRFFRKFRKFIRYVKYLYTENKYVFHIGILLLIALISTLIYLNLNVYNKAFEENNAFRTNEFTLNIKDSFITKYNYYGDKIDPDYQFVVVRVSIKQATAKPKVLKTPSLALEINDHHFYHTIDYKTEFNDFGNIYNSENIDINFGHYIMVYKIPNSFIEDKMVLRFYDNNKKVISINLNPEIVNSEKVIDSNNLGEVVVLDKTVLNKTSFIIDSAEVSGLFKEVYNFCDVNNNCYDSIEYVRSKLSGNEDKSLLKLTGNVVFDKDLHVNEIKTLYTFVKRFGRLTYTVGENTKTISLNLPQIKPSKVYDKMKTYIEVPKEVESASSIVLNINVRNKVYNYVLK